MGCKWLLHGWNRKNDILEGVMIKFKKLLFFFLCYGNAFILTLQHLWRWHQWAQTKEYKFQILSIFRTRMLNFKSKMSSFWSSGMAIASLLKFPSWLPDARLILIPFNIYQPARMKAAPWCLLSCLHLETESTIFGWHRNHVMSGNLKIFNFLFTLIVNTSSTQLSQPTLLLDH